MNVANNKIKFSEKFFNKNKNSKSAISLANTYYISFYSTNDKSYLEKALNILESMIFETPADTDLYMALVFINIESDNIDKSVELIEKLNSYKSYYKNNDSNSYIKYLFLLIMLEKKQHNTKLVKKHMKMLTEYTEKMGDKLVYLLFGIIEISLENYEEGYEYLKKSYDMGSRSVLLFIGMHKYFSKKNENEKLDKLIFLYITWAMAHSFDLTQTMEFYKVYLSNVVTPSIDFYKKVYKKYKNIWALKIICNKLVIEKSNSIDAFRYYKQLESKQLLNLDYIQFLVRSAFLNDIYDLSRYSIEMFLKFKNIDVDIRAFMYYVILTNDKFEELVEKHINEIIQFALYGIENKIKTRYFSNIYYYFFKSTNKDKIYATYNKYIENILKNEIFQYEIITTNKSIKFVWVSEKELTEMQVIEVTSGKGFFKASSKDFEYFCLDESGKILIHDELKILKTIENVDVETCKYFMKKGVTDLPVLVFLANDAINLKKYTEDCMYIINTILKYKEISQTFRMQLNATLGSILNSQNKYDKALEYYKTVDETYLDDRFIEQMLAVFLNTMEYKKAVNLILKKSHLISDRNLFYAVKKITTDEHYHQYLADICYELLLKSWYDKSLVDIVIRNYNGSQEDWHELTKVLMEMSIEDVVVDEIILRNCIWMHKYDVGSQKVFVRVYTHFKESAYIKEFVYYSIYVMLIQKIAPEYDTIQVLEEIYLKTNDKYLAYALSNIYLEKGIITPIYGKIIDEANNYMEQDGILFPIFKTCKDKNIITPYIEKNQPFIYTAFPDKKVFLHYQLEIDGVFFVKQMKYLRFGLYMTTLVHFFSEKISYFFSEETSSGSIESKIFVVENNKANIIETQDDIFFKLNNALIYGKMFKFENVEKIIWEQLREPYEIKGKLL